MNLCCVIGEDKTQKQNRKIGCKRDNLYFNTEKNTYSWKVNGSNEKDTK